MRPTTPLRTTIAAASAIAALSLLVAAGVSAQTVTAIKAPYTSVMPVEFGGGHKLDYCPGTYGGPPPDPTFPIPVTWEVRFENPTDVPVTVVYSDDIQDGLNGTRLELQCPLVLLPPGVIASRDVTCGRPGAGDLEVRNIVVPACGRVSLRYNTVIDLEDFSLDYICDGGTVNEGALSSRTVPPVPDHVPNPPPSPSDPQDTCIFVSMFCNPLDQDLRMGHYVTDLNGGPLLPGDDIRVNAWMNLRWLDPAGPGMRLGEYMEESIDVFTAGPIPAFVDFLRFTSTPLDIQGAIYDFNTSRELTILPGATAVRIPAGVTYEFLEWEGRVNCSAPPGETMAFRSLIRTFGGGFFEADDPTTLDARPDPSEITPVHPDFSGSTKTVTDGNRDGLAQPGETLTFTVNVTNSTTCPADKMDCECETTDVEIRDLVDTSRLEDVTVLDGGGLAGATAAWDLDTMGAAGRPGASATVRFTARVRTDVRDGDRICNTATVTSASLKSVADGGLLENCASFPPTSITLSPCLEIDVPTTPFLVTGKAITSPAAPGPYAVGTTLTFSITVENVGLATATAVEVWDCLSTTCWGDPSLSVTPRDGGVLNGGTNPGCPGSWIRWTIGSLAGGASTTVRFDGTIPRGLADLTSCSNTAFADSAETALAASAPVPWDVCAPVLSFTKTLPPTPVTYPRGGTITWTIQVTNSGSCDATGIRVTDVIDTINLAEPPTFDVPPGASGSYSAPTDTITWTLPPVAASGGTTSFTVSSTIVGPAPGTVCDRAGMTWDQGAAEVFTSAAPGTCAPFNDGGACALIPEIKTVKGRKEPPSNVYFEWLGIIEATDGYRVCRVDGFANRSDIPITCDTPDPSIAPVCDPTPVTSCTHVGGLPGAAGSIYYYQVKGLCDAVEGP